MGILVAGSINMDIVNRVKRHPLPGETIKGINTNYSPGGKGANQAAAASLAGGTVTMIGAVGKDPYGQVLLDSLAKSGVHTDGIFIKKGTSGMAFITVDDSGENTIILSEGANGRVEIQDVKEKTGLFDQAQILLLQNEIPLETTLFVLKEAHSRGVKTWFNPAPALRIPEDVFPLIDCMVLNETEIEVVTGRKADSPVDWERAVQWLLDRGTGAVILTLGEKGSIYSSEEEKNILTPGFKVEAVDTTSAGDAFIGALAAAKAAGKTIKEALLFATAASALTVTRHGAQGSIPAREEIAGFLRSKGFHFR